MEDTSTMAPRFPKDLVEWAGHHSGASSVYSTPTAAPRQGVAPDQPDLPT